MQHSKTYDVDDLMWKTLKSLLHDFYSSLPPSFSRTLAQIISDKNVTELRELSFNHQMHTSVDTYKRVYQMINLCKRVVFKNDVFSESELVAQATDKFKATQIRLASLSELSPQARDVLFWARGLTHEILGDFTNTELNERCEFGKHAAVGVPYRKATLLAKWETITGSEDDLKWFESDYLGFNRLLDEFLKENYIERETSSELKLTFVPKSFKACRAITPNTTVGSLRSDGLGKMIASRLRRVGLDITCLQEFHRELAQLGSWDHSLVTCDQRSASDNITGWLLELLLPKSWYKELNTGRISLIRLPDGVAVKSETFCTMGVGFTFPLQTLVFYCLAKAISLSSFDGEDFVSCYGDDLIVDARLWPLVRDLFPEFGLEINEDKTFFEGDFRESCGGDFYRGVDVRPFQPQVSGALKRVAYDSCIYKFINGLRRRWCDEEIDETLTMLELELRDEMLVVPMDYPDISGVRVQRGDRFWSSTQRLIRNRNGAVIFTYLKQSALEVECLRQLPYYCRSLRSGTVEIQAIKFKNRKYFVPLPGTGPFIKVRGVSILL